MFDDVSSVFRIFMFIYFALAVLVVLLLLINAFRNDSRTSEQLRVVLRIVLFLGAMFGIFSWFVA